MSALSMPRRVAGAAVAVAAFALLRAGSVAPLTGAAGDAGALRLSWSARPERIETCRRLSDAELAERPQHMRMRWECEGLFARYALDVRADGGVLAADTVRGGGLRHDRSMHLLREYALPAGARHLQIELRRIEAEIRPDTAETGVVAAGTGSADRDTRESQERRARRGESLPEVLRLDTTLVVPPRGVILVTYLNSERRFDVRVPR